MSDELKDGGGEANPRVSLIIERLQQIHKQYGDLICVYESCGAPFLPVVFEGHDGMLVDLVGA